MEKNPILNKTGDNYGPRIQEAGLMPTTQLVRRVKQMHEAALSEALIMRAFSAERRKARKQTSAKEANT